MRVRAAAYDFSHPGDYVSNKPKGSPFYIVQLAKSPAVVVEGGKEYPIKENQMIIYKKRRARHFYSPGKPFRHDWIQFVANAEDDAYIEKLGIPMNTVLTLSSPLTLSEIIAKIVYELASKSKYSESILDSYIRLFLLKTAEMIGSEGEGSRNQYYDQFLHIRSQIYNYPEKEWAPQALAKEINVSLSHFQHNYRKIFGCSFITDVIQSRITRAKYCLTDSENSVEKVAELCGYNNVFHFINQFKKYVGVTPGQYRKKI